MTLVIGIRIAKKIGNCRINGSQCYRRNFVYNLFEIYVW